MKRVFDQDELGLPSRVNLDLKDGPIRKVLAFKLADCISTIRNSFEENQKQQGFFISGPEVSGKTTLALLIARSIFESTNDFEIFYAAQSDLYDKNNPYTNRFDPLPSKSVCILDDIDLVDQEWKRKLTQDVSKKLIDWSVMPIFISSLHKGQMNDNYGAGFFARIQKVCHIVKMSVIEAE